METQTPSEEGGVEDNNSSDSIEVEYFIIKEEPETDLDSDNHSGNSSEDETVQQKEQIKREPPSFPCHLCNAKHQTTSALAFHIYQTHRKTECSLCKRQLANFPSLKKHLEIHSQLRKSYKCKICCRPYTSSRGKVEKHQKSHMSETELRQSCTKFWTCYFCKEIVLEFANLEEHSRRHTQEKPYRCSLCKNRSFTGNSGLHFHTKSVHKSNSITIEQWKFKCPHCQKKFQNASQLNIHLPRHSDKKAFTCPDCDKSFKFRPELVAHRKIHEDVCKFECKECGHRTTSAWKLKQHSLSHSDKRPFKCGQCTLAFKIERDLKKHIVVLHDLNQKKDWKCPVCKKSFREKSKLTSHSIVMHQQKDPKKQWRWTCEICGKMLAAKATLKSHMKQHSSQPAEQHPCPFPGCGKEYSEIANLRRHQKACHEGIRWSCDQKDCGKAFTGSVSLRDHKRTVHGIGGLFSCKVEGCGLSFSGRWGLTQHVKVSHQKAKLIDA